MLLRRDGLTQSDAGGRCSTAAIRSTAVAIAPFAPRGRASAVFFVATDCPISNWYAPTIQQVCRDYAARGVDCTLVYEDLDLGPTPAALDPRSARISASTATGR